VLEKLPRTLSLIDTSTGPDCGDDICRVRRDTILNVDDDEGWYLNDEMLFRSDCMLHKGRIRDSVTVSV
jgi:hypothetical protein